MRITNATFSKLNQFIEPKTTFLIFLSEVMKEKLASILGGWDKKSCAQVLKLAKSFTLKKM